MVPGVDSISGLLVSLSLSIRNNRKHLWIHPPSFFFPTTVFTYISEAHKESIALCIKPILALQIYGAAPSSVLCSLNFVFLWYTVIDIKSNFLVSCQYSLNLNTVNHSNGRSNTAKGDKEISTCQGSSSGDADACFRLCYFAWREYQSSKA